jgi:hypothetical protein
MAQQKKAFIVAGLASFCGACFAVGTGAPMYLWYIITVLVGVSLMFLWALVERNSLK